MLGFHASRTAMAGAVRPAVHGEFRCDLAARVETSEPELALNAGILYSCLAQGKLPST